VGHEAAGAESGTVGLNRHNGKVQFPLVSMGRFLCRLLPPTLVATCRKAKRLTDRHAPVLEQRAMAALVTNARRPRKAN